MKPKGLENDLDFRKAWAKEFRGNSKYDFYSMSQCELNSFRETFLNGWLAGRKYRIKKAKLK